MRYFTSKPCAYSSFPEPVIQTPIAKTVSLESLCQSLALDPQAEQAPPLDPQPDFPLRVPEHFAQQMRPGDWQDPLLRQVLPLAEERNTVEGYHSDPVGDRSASLQPALIQKYQGRALLIASPKCDIHCRYCFRRHYPYEQARQAHWRAALQHLHQRPDIHELILSGGDPLSLSDGALTALLDDIAEIEHLTTLRIHSRTPVVAPERISNTLIERLRKLPLSVVLVVHCNHANELSDQTQALFAQCKAAEMTLLNQTVLLKGVNDDSETLAALSRKLFAQGVLPYYCHLLDKVAGAAHFDLPQHQAWSILDALRRQLPGYLVPRLVREDAGEPYKTLVTAQTTATMQE
ncbi:MAG: EF-P beta-lysylation protein EpmB [Hydrogenovibrio sp.]|uniref:EF-P beta-lysylation protein EpmB n=1 Tax=Hydrogenovibrio sp. TaxID=2065821 RepID=UPI00287062D5|nr:EF-P beta-lysylation protein EpmB [Hydrogenovibrio sp.]MDR9498478.1 EF-P beta-lysylation protein EpmB [Hydrogenovibrio sp.]